MRELKIFIIVLIFVGITYWGIEPYAHTKLHPQVAPADYNFEQEDIDLAKTNIEKAKKDVAVAEKRNDPTSVKNAKNDLEAKEEMLKKYTDFWHSVDRIDLSKGDPKAGAELFDNTGCSGCHGLKIAGKPAVMSSMDASEAYGVNPPDLSTSGKIYDAKFLAALIKNPPMALKLTHKFNDTNPFPMPDFSDDSEAGDKEIADIVAYLKSVAPKEVSDKEVFVDACVRCHDMKYAKIYTDGNKAAVAKYLGSTPPDLSIMIRAKSKSYLHEFMNDTQKMLPGTSMPRVGLTHESEVQIINYMEQIGDSKKAEREKTSIYIMIYFFILAIFATLWKRKIWSSLH